MRERGGRVLLCEVGTRGEASFCVQNFGEFRKKRNEVRAKEKQNLDKREILEKNFCEKVCGRCFANNFPDVPLISDF